MKTIITALAFLFIVSANAQKFQGKAVYKTHRKSSFKVNGGKGAPNTEMEKRMAERLKKMYQKTYTLNFTKDESTYAEDVSLSAPSPKVSGGFQIMSFGSNSGTLYKNLKKGTYLNKSEIMGQPFLINDQIKNLDWKLTSETKNIGMYTCYKAVFEEEVENKSMTVLNGELEETAEKVTKITTAWYTPQIPVTNGPDSFGGLPGLILEINDGSLTIVCAEVILNPSERIAIEAPKKGRKISQKAFDKLSDEKSKEMLERFQTRGGSGDGIQIRIGG